MVPREVCTTVDREVCATVPTEKCADVPREVCETKCEDVFWCKVSPLLLVLNRLLAIFSRLFTRNIAYSLSPVCSQKIPVCSHYSPVSCFRCATSNLSSDPPLHQIRELKPTLPPLLHHCQALLLITNVNT